MDERPRTSVAAAGRTAQDPGPPAAAADDCFHLPTSFAQRRLWFLDRFDPGAALYNVPVGLALRGRLDRRALAEALAAIVARHETLRTTFAAGDPRSPDGGLPLQVVRLRARLALPVVDLAALPAARRRPAAERLAATAARRPFDLGSGPLFCAVLVALGENERGEREHHLLLTLHHIVADGWSIGVLFRELGALYGALAHRPAAAERLPPSPPLTIQYADFAAWQLDRLTGTTLERLVEHWRRALAGAPELIELPAARPRPPRLDARGAARERPLPAAAIARLRRFAGERGGSSFMALLAVFQALLVRHGAGEDLVIATPVAGRDRAELEGLIGLFVNLLPLRTDASGDPPFAELFDRVRAAALDAYAHQELPFEKLVEELSPRRSPDRTPLAQLVFAIDEEPPAVELAGLEARPLAIELGSAKFDLGLTVPLTAGGAVARVEYRTALFDAAAVERLLASFAALVEGAAADPGRRLSELPALGPGERHQVVREWNDTAALAPADLCLHHGFERRARERPGAPAVAGAGGEVLSYGELEAWANRLARRLRRHGVGRGTLVGVHLDRTPAMVAAVLAVHKAGGAYVPLEAAWPPERIRWILDRNRIRHLVTAAGKLARLAEMAPRPALAALVAVDPLEGDAGGGAAVWRAAGAAVAGAAEVAAEPDEPLPASAAAAEPDDLAYIIFTSGSTGRPKGVMVRHRPAVNLVHWVNSTFGVGPDDRLLFVAALAFDLSVYDLFGTLAAGGSVRVASEPELRDPERLVAILLGERITFWDSAPAALVQCAPFFPVPGTAECWLRRVFLSGDWIPVTLPDRVRDAFGCRVIALGGATEATVWSNVYPVGRVDPSWPSIPYGRPIANARYHVLDARRGPCPVAVPGDLAIGGPVLADGYAADPRQTALQFVPDPFADGSPAAPAGGRLYATGDRARHLADGNLEFLGRLDSQVKVRGHRIELGEIEAVLAADPGLAEAVAVVREDVPGDQRLVAYFLPAPGAAAPDAEALRARARGRLPEYMVPSAYLAVARWPLSPTGKLDRKALPRPDAAAPAGGAAGVSPAAPAALAGALEAELAAIWRQTIGVSAVGRDDSFFDLGGHSLLMAKVQTLIAERLGRRVPMIELFAHPTVASLAASLAAAGAAAPARAPAPAAAAAVRPATRRAGGEIAVVGMAGRFPGAPGVDELWDLLAAGRHGLRTFSDRELLEAGVDPAAVANPGLIRTRGALDGHDLFDAGFFDLPPREAQLLDPQQRLLLETSWEALEDAGCDPARAGAVGVFAGVSDSEWGRALRADRALVRRVGLLQIALGNQSDYAATRAAYKLDLTGPALTVQTACSTSLVAVHLACRSLLAGECDLALAGGSSVLAREVDAFVRIDGSIDSPDGHTRAFDAAAAGVGSGSGVGVVALKRLEDALADGDAVRAVILGSAINNDGAHKVGFVAPSEEGQAGAIRRAHRAAAVDPRTITYVEAHGTGTAIGDPIEVAGLTRAFRDATAERGFCALGSVKTNLGHLDAAAGIAGLIKTVLALERRLIPASLGFERPNPAIDWDGSPFYVAAETLDWPAAGGAPRRAGVSSFGMGGTNAHAVLEEAPAAEPSGEARPAQLLVLSAKTAGALEAAAGRLAAHLEGRPDLDGRALADAAWTLQTGRRAFAHRRALVVRSRADAVALLRGAGEPGEARRAAAGVAAGAAPGVVFLFPGQGSQHPGMGAELYAAEPVYRREVDRAAALLAPELGLDLRDLLYPAEPPAGAARERAAARLTATALAQPALFVVEHALARLWLSWGVEPAAMLGHSIGEYAAACLAGVFDLEAALRLVAARGRLMGALPGGSMLAVELAEDELAERLAELPAAELAAINGPRACVVSGPGEALERLAGRLAAEGVGVRRLHTSHAFHSAAMEPVLEEFAAAVAAAAPRPPERPFVSNLTGTWITAAEAVNPGYWARHLRRPVRFADGLATALAEPGRVLLEVGPGWSLATFARQHPARRAAAAVAASMRHPRRDVPDGEQLLAAAGRLWCAGVGIDWRGMSGHERRRKVRLPAYPFERRRFGLDAPAAQAAGNGTAAGVDAGGSDGTGTPTPGGAAPAASAALTATEQAVAAVWADLLGVGEVAAGDDFFDLGGSSLVGVRLASLLRRELGVELPASFLLEAPTLAEQAARIDALRAGAAPRESSCLVRVQRGEAGRRPLFLVHQVGGHVFTFRALARELGAAQPLYGLRSRGLEAGEEPLTTIGAMADHYLEAIRAEQPAGPYRIGGASMGGMVAFEIARRLTAAGEQVELLTLMDTPCGDQMPVREEEADPVYLVVRDRTGLRLDHRALTALPAGERFAWALERVREAGLEERFDAAECSRMAHVLGRNVDALYAHRPEPWPGRLLFFRARERRPGDPPRPELPWIELATAGTETVIVPGDHETMHEPPHVEAVARRLRYSLDRE